MNKNKLSREELLMVIDKIMNYYFLNKQSIERDEMIELNQAKKQIKSILTSILEDKLDEFVGKCKELLHEEVGGHAFAIPSSTVKAILQKYDELKEGG